MARRALKGRGQGTLPSMSTDHFSGHAAQYARSRPDYPPALFDFVATLGPARELAWDCGCGNGQASGPLAERFERVHATDVSAPQVAQAPAHPRITYRVAPAEVSGLPASSVDVVAVAQALHWFATDAFFAEVRRVLKQGGALAAWTYRPPTSGDALDEVQRDFHRRVVGPYWPPERHWVDEGYVGLPFPFARVETPAFAIERTWTQPEWLDYLGSWSASQRYQAVRGEDPRAQMREALERAWPDPAQPKHFTWEVVLLAGR